MAAPSDDLYVLIKSLTPSEKRYFKLFARRQGLESSKLYVRVFDLIDAQQDGYDELRIKKKLKTPLAVRQYAQTKSYLFDLVMKSMRLFRSEKDVANEVFDLIQDELFYTEKGLRELRIKALNRAKELAYTFDLTYLLVPILRRERVYALKFPEDDPFEHLKKIQAEEAIVFERLNNESKLAEVFYGLHTQLIIDPTLREPVDLPGFATARDQMLQTRYEDLHTFYEKFFWLRSKSLMYRVERNYTKHYEITRQLLDLFTHYPQHRMNVMGNYMEVLAQYLGAGHMISNYSEFESTLDILRSMPAELPKDRLTIDTIVFQYSMLYYMNTGKLHMVDEIRENFDALKQKYANQLSESFIISMSYNLALMYFYNEQFEQAVDYCNELIHMDAQMTSELIHGAQLLYLLLLVETGNSIYFTSAIRSAVHTMKSQNKYRAFERTYCSFLKKLNQKPIAERKPVFEEMFAAFLAMVQNGGPRNYVFTTEVLAWSRSRIEGTPLAAEASVKYT